MRQLSDESEFGDINSTAESQSVLRTLLVVVFVGPSLGRLGLAVIEAISVTFSISRTGAVVLVGALAVAASFQLTGFRPSVLASACYFVVEQLAFVLLVFGIDVFGSPGSPLSPWSEVGLQSLSIAIAVALVFSAVGKHGRKLIRRCGRKLLKLPSADDQGDRQR